MTLLGSIANNTLLFAKAQAICAIGQLCGWQSYEHWCHSAQPHTDPTNEDNVVRVRQVGEYELRIILPFPHNAERLSEGKLEANALSEEQREKLHYFRRYVGFTDEEWEDDGTHSACVFDVDKAIFIASAYGLDDLKVSWAVML